MELASEPVQVEAGIAGIGFVTSFVDDFPVALAFYTEVLGLADPAPMGPTACFFELADGTALYLIGGNYAQAVDTSTVRTSFAFRVDSVSRLIEKLKIVEAEVLLDEPMQMNEKSWWLQFRDPAGNLLEVIGGK